MELTNRQKSRYQMFFCLFSFFFYVFETSRQYNGDQVLMSGQPLIYSVIVNVLRDSQLANTCPNITLHAVVNIHSPS